MTTHPTPEALAADFNRYFTSANGVDVPARVSVPRDEWRAVYAALSAELAQAKTDLHIATDDAAQMLASTQALSAELAAARAEAATERALSFRDQVAALEAERDSLRAEVERLRTGIIEPKDHP
jgi:transglutaminase-like putative cysteine protease